MQSNSNSQKTKKALGGLTRAPTCYLLDRLIDSEVKRALILCANEEEADRWQSDLEFFFSFKGRAWKGNKILRIPPWEHSPFSSLMPGIASRLERIASLEYICKNHSAWIAVASIQAATQVIPDLNLLHGAINLSRSFDSSPEALAAHLEKIGYQKSDSVEDRGTYSIRGGILDIFSTDGSNPIRIDFSDDKIDSIREFNPETQRSIRLFAQNESTRIIPAREFFCHQDSLQKARERIKIYCDENDLPKTARERISSLLNQGILSPEMDYLIPFFQDEPCFIDQLLRGKNATLILAEPSSIKKSHSDFLEQEEQRFTAAIAREQITAKINHLYKELSAIIDSDCWTNQIEISELALNNQSTLSTRAPALNPAKKAGADLIKKTISPFIESGTRVIIVANSQSQIDRILYLLSQQKIQSVQITDESKIPKDPTVICLVIGVISESFFLSDDKLFFLSEDSIFGEKNHRGIEKRKRKPSAPLAMNDLIVGDLVVHDDHGIGRFCGLSKISTNGVEVDFVVLEYTENDKLYVPIYRLESIGRYIGNSDTDINLDKLGSGSFSKAKERVKGAIKDIAQELLKINAERASREGFRFSEPDEQFREFEAEFPYDETPDQQIAIEETISDMCHGKPMDRLICGDVGFGKTEVAVRAAFKCAQDGKQAAILVPTTILAEQHYITFSERMKNLPVRIASISRFRSKKEQEDILINLKNGTIDIIVGTHRLLSKDIEFKDLGLLIIDEEQRFGVEHKEKIKKIKANTDILTLTATPIPRTLQMSLMGLKDVSIIRTPPGDRMSIKTYLSIFDEEVIKDAIEHELNRGGQVFFIHNRIQDMAAIVDLIQKIVPRAKVVFAHGQMPEQQLEKAMRGFYRKEFDVLVATAIIENGLDVPNANTLIVNRADTFGLAQLYQIRGRVGRSQIRAFCHFLLPESGLVTDEAKARLGVLQRFVDLGSGYFIANHDLEIRGGGDLLGQAQSGHIATVGYEMYLNLLQEEIHRIKGEQPTQKLEDVEINLPFSALLPFDYVPDTKTRMSHYRRLSALSNEEEVNDAQAEFQDRYGELPKETKELLDVVRLKILMRRMGLRSLTLGPRGISISPGKNPILEPGMILQLVQAYPRNYAILPDNKFVIHGSFRAAGEIHVVLRQLLGKATQ